MRGLVKNKLKQLRLLGKGRGLEKGKGEGAVRERKGEGMGGSDRRRGAQMRVPELTDGS